MSDGRASKSRRQGRDADDPEFRRALAKEEFVEGFLDAIDGLMRERGVTRRELAMRLGCSAANVTQLMRRSRNITAETMADIAFHLGYTLSCVLAPAANNEQWVDKGDVARPAGSRSGKHDGAMRVADRRPRLARKR